MTASEATQKALLAPISRCSTRPGNVQLAEGEGATFSISRLCPAQQQMREASSTNRTGSSPPCARHKHDALGVTGAAPQKWAPPRTKWGYLFAYACAFACLFTFVCMYLFVCLFVSSSSYLSKPNLCIHPSIHPSIYLST